MTGMMETNENNYVDFVVTARKYKTLLTNKYINRPVWEKHEPGEVLTGLPGTVMDIIVKKGQKVKEGELVMTIEAMKMINRIKSPVAGTVRDIFVKCGDKVEKNHLMLKIEPK